LVSSLAPSVLKNPGTTCPAVADGNGYYNPPYVASAYPATAGQTWLYICYDNSPGTDYLNPPSGLGQHDLNVIVVYTYSPLTPLLVGQFGTFHLANNIHLTIQGP